MPPKERSTEPDRNEQRKLIRDLKIITAISLGKKRNKELAIFLDTDKSHASKKIKELEQKGLIHKEGTGKETRYELNPFNVLHFLQRKVVITVRKKEKKKEEVLK